MNYTTVRILYRPQACRHDEDVILQTPVAGPPEKLCNPSLFKENPAMM